MRPNCFLLLLCCCCFISLCAQNRAAHMTTHPQYYRCGDISIPGTQLTVEALVKLDGTGPYVTGQSANDIVSKHYGGNDANYILRPDHAEITTTNGHFYTPYNLALFTKDSSYHVAMTYDGSFLKFYVNGCLHAQTAATGNLITNAHITTIGQLAAAPTQLSIEQLYGYTDEVRIWNRVRSQNEIKANMHDLPNPTTQTGLLAYYKFEGNSINVQGNAAFNALPNNNPQIELREFSVRNFDASFSVTQPSCSGNGNIVVTASGGKAPYQYSINGGAFQSSNTFSNLGPGTYLVTVKADGLGCSKDTTVTMVQNCATTTCFNWLRLPSHGSFMNVGDLDIPGNQITVEATFNRTTPWNGADVFQGDLVSKHENNSDCNYLLRPGSAEITTTNGYFKTPTICNIQLNKTYHVAMVYDGTTLKFYRNGFLMSQIPATGALIQNNRQTRVGLYNTGITQENFVGYVNEVRIWNVVRSQGQIQSFMNSSLPTPSTQAGLLAYYTFDNLLNKQGNTTWNGTLGGAAAINQTNPNCTITLDSCNVVPVSTVAAFSAPDTVCVNAPVNLVNNSTATTTQNWSFCSQPLHATENSLIGLAPGTLIGARHVALVSDGPNYYAFAVSNYNSFVRLNFGNSLQNVPTVTPLGAIAGLPPTPSVQGIQVVRTPGSGIWRLIYVYNSPSPAVGIITLGNSLSNLPAGSTNTSLPASINAPHDLTLFLDNGSYIGFVTDPVSHQVVRLSFDADLSNVTTTNLGNPGNLLAGPTGMHAIKENGSWYGLVANSATGRIVRLSFGNSLTNTPTAVMVPSVVPADPRDIHIVSSCGRIWATVLHSNNSVTNLDFGSSVVNIPLATINTTLTGMNGPNANSALLRDGNDAFALVVNSGDNSLSRLRFTGCFVGVPAGTNQVTPAGISFGTPGTYEIQLTVNALQPTQAVACRTIVVLPLPTHTPLQNFSICQGDSLRIGTQSGLTGYQWSNGAASDSITISQPGLYWVQSNRNGCINRDSFQVASVAKPTLIPLVDSSVCRGTPITLSTNPAGNYIYAWTPSLGLSSTNTASTIATPAATTQYTVTATNGNGCITRDTVTITVRDVPLVQLGNDTLLCSGSSWTLNAGNPGSGYVWQDGSTTQNYAVSDSGAYHVAVTANGCSAADSIHIGYHPKQGFAAPADTSVCQGNSVTLALQTQGTWNVAWTPVTGLSAPTGLNPIATPAITTMYHATGTGNFGCQSKDSVLVTVRPKPSVTVTSATTICSGSSLQLQAGGGSAYQWSPAVGLSSATIPNPTASPTATTTYLVTVADQWQCTATDSVRITVQSKPTFSKPGDAVVCTGDSVQLTSINAGFNHHWSPATSLTSAVTASPRAFPAATTVYTLLVSDPACNYDSSFQVTVRVNPLPNVTAQALNEITCAQTSAQLQAGGAAVYSWSPATGLNQSNIANPLCTVTANTLYTVYGVDANGCRNWDSVTVKAGFGGTMVAYIPSAFTPNRDGLNDCFGVAHWGPVTELDFAIYNRWGQLIFRTTDPGRCWDGTLNGKEQATGVFAYVIKAKTACGPVQKNGLVTLIR